MESLMEGYRVQWMLPAWPHAGAEKGGRDRMCTGPGPSTRTVTEGWLLLLAHIFFPSTSHPAHSRTETVSPGSLPLCGGVSPSLWQGAVRPQNPTHSPTRTR